MISFMQSFKQFSHGLLQNRVKHIGSNFGKRKQHKLAKMHAGMRNRQLRPIDNQIINHQDIDIDWSVGIIAILTLFCSSQLFFNGLRNYEYIIDRHFRNHFAHNVHKAVFRRKSLGRRNIKSGLGNDFITLLSPTHRLYFFPYRLNSILIPKIPDATFHHNTSSVNNKHGIAICPETVFFFNGHFISIHYLFVTAKSTCRHQ